MIPNGSFLHYLAESLPEDQRYILHDAVKMHSTMSIYVLLMQLESDVLRPTLNKRGANDATYIFLKQVKDIMIQAGEQNNMLERQNERMYALEKMNQLLTEDNARLNKELNRYRTVEEMAIEGTLQSYIGLVLNQMKKSELQNKTKAVTDGS